MRQWKILLDGHCVASIDAETEEKAWDEAARYMRRYDIEEEKEP